MAIKLLHQHCGFSVCLKKEPAEKQTVSTDAAPPPKSDAKLNLRNVKKHTHKHTENNNNNNKKGTYGFTDGLEDTINEAGLFWQG